ncbi:FAD-binding oxidoreductase [Streptomyces sp. XM4193]|uniref:NAD(P)/FAD-dependent oxidoreductase n=1 Tax=Streptomyces sp. XM4193 TaxID=2929782 RepID=UPI001FF9F6B7|nr:FAD-dependent oxidoreductase [Streptomyces sp. XM4193]MCK1798989.1 FAD-binding oxidoreductase [Streptomyces sp. XM4193]
MVTPLGCDVAVLGAGVVGLSTAWLLARRGAAVTLLDSGTAGAGASLGAQGQLVPPSPGLRPLFRRSLALYTELAERTGMPWDAEPAGTLVLSAPGAAGSGAAPRTFPDAATLTGEELRALEPALGPLAESGLLLSEGRRIEPAAVLGALLAEATGAGAQLRLGLGPLRLQEAGAAGWALVRADGERLTAPRVVIAAGTGARSLLAPLGLHVPLTPVNGRVIVTEPAPFTLERILAESVIGVPRSVALLAHQAPDGALVLGGSWYPHDEAEPEDLATRILHRADALVPGTARLRITAQRGGLRPFLPDRVPVVDRLAPGLYGCFGHGGEGYIAGPGSAELLVDLLAADQHGSARPTAEQQTLHAGFRFGRWKEHP